MPKKTVNFAIEPDLLKALDEECITTKRSRSSLISIAIEQHLNGSKPVTTKPISPAHPTKRVAVRAVKVPAKVPAKKRAVKKSDVTPIFKKGS